MAIKFTIQVPHADKRFQIVNQTVFQTLLKPFGVCEEYHDGLTREFEAILRFR